MIGFLATLLILGGGWCVDTHRHSNENGQNPYVQSRVDFLRASLTLQELVPHDENNLTNPATREHLSAGVLSAVTMTVGKYASYFCSQYDPLSVLQDVWPSVWTNYNGVAADPLNKKLAEIDKQVQNITAIIDGQCYLISVEACNEQVERIVQEDDSLLHEARLLLAVGKVARTLNLHEKEIREVVSEYKDAPYLIKLMQAMYILIQFLLTWSVVKSDPLNLPNDLDSVPPPYLQSKYEFAKAATYLQQQLPFYNLSEQNKEFGVIVRIISELAYGIRPQNPPQRYMPYKILDDYLPKAWTEYKFIDNKTREFVLDAESKIMPMTSTLDTKCKAMRDIDVCNKMAANIIKRKVYLQPHANLLLQLGRVSKNFNAFSNTLDVLSLERQQIPFLKHHLEDSHIRHYIKELYKTYSLIKSI
ncbi:unnamed protein product [Danaus chrysippus]|uniref:(African queen) hypothetical protein n=1 Tax=Danaus chrysippus TaxID=151541 RepID=A0A8J2R1S7_9NEOP|nr:unnamed protein product [Danaus chrysippus]